MAYSTPAGIKIEYDQTAGGTLVEIQSYIQTFNGVDIEQVLEEIHAFGDSWEEHLPVGIGKVGDITLGGLYDSAASPAPDALFGNRIPENPNTGQTRTLKITWTGTKTTSVTAFVTSYKTTLAAEKLHVFTVQLQPSGTVTEA